MSQDFSIKKLVEIMYNEEECTKYDVVINYVAIENYYGENSCGFDLYEKFYENSPTICYNVKKWVNKFKALIDSFEKKGNLTKTKSILLSWGDFKGIRNGNHRFACCLYFKEKTCGVCMRNCHRKGMGNLASLVQKGFTEDELKFLENKANEIKREFL